MNGAQTALHRALQENRTYSAGASTPAVTICITPELIIGLPKTNASAKRTLQGAMDFGASARALTLAASSMLVDAARFEVPHYSALFLKLMAAATHYAWNGNSATQQTIRYMADDDIIAAHDQYIAGAEAMPHQDVVFTATAYHTIMYALAKSRDTQNLEKNIATRVDAMLRIQGAVEAPVVEIPILAKAVQVCHNLHPDFRSSTLYSYLMRKGAQMSGEMSRESYSYVRELCTYGNMGLVGKIMEHLIEPLPELMNIPLLRTEMQLLEGLFAAASAAGNLQVPTMFLGVLGTGIALSKKQGNLRMLGNILGRFLASQVGSFGGYRQGDGAGLPLFKELAKALHLLMASPEFTSAADANARTDLLAHVFFTAVQRNPDQMATYAAGQRGGAAGVPVFLDAQSGGGTTA